MEGMKIRKNDDGFVVRIVREDETRILFTNDLLTTKFAALKNERYFYVIDENVARLYSEALAPLLAGGKYFIMPGGDENKNNASLSMLLSALYEKKLSRKGTIVAIGGGVVTDISGLAANLYFRGIKVIHVPTTLLAMVDAAIGGKVGINHPFQKNLLGSFYQPASVMIDKHFLLSLPREELESAMGEVLKIGIVGASDVFDALNGFSYEGTDFEPLIRACVWHKVRLLGDNCYERRLDRILNFGHTVGHPIEDISCFRIKHGAAVAMGIGIATSIARQRGVCTAATAERIYRMMRRLNLVAFDNDLDVQRLWEHVQRLVLQRGGEGLLYVLPVSIGNVTIVKNITHEEFLHAVEECKRQVVQRET